MSGTTRWTLIDLAARGDDAARGRFVALYERPVRAYLSARWRDTPLLAEIDDTTQEVFIQCLRDGGVLERADPARGGFRAFLYGIVRREAQKAEVHRARDHAHRAEGISAERVPADESTLSHVFDRQWALDLMRDAYERFAGAAGDADRQRRVELLRLRFEDGLAVREIAARWGEGAAHLHRELTRAKDEFRRALCDAIAEREGYRGQNLDLECEFVLSRIGGA